MDILALVLRRPKLDVTQRVLPMFMLKPMTSSKKCSVSKLGIKIRYQNQVSKIRILAIRNISNGLNAGNAVQAEVEQLIPFCYEPKRNHLLPNIFNR